MFSFGLFQLGQQVVLVANDQCVGQANLTVTEAEEAVHVFKNLAIFTVGPASCVSRQ